MKIKLTEDNIRNKKKKKLKTNQLACLIRYVTIITDKYYCLTLLEGISNYYAYQIKKKTIKILTIFTINIDIFILKKKIEKNFTFVNYFCYLTALHYNYFSNGIQKNKRYIILQFYIII